jgi:hypothetical protein
MTHVFKYENVEQKDLHYVLFMVTMEYKTYVIKFGDGT